MAHERRTGTPRINGDEQDALGPSKRMFRWRSGMRAKIKAAYNRRARKLPVEIEPSGNPG